MQRETEILTCPLLPLAVSTAGSCHHPTTCSVTLTRYHIYPKILTILLDYMIIRQKL